MGFDREGTFRRNNARSLFIADLPLAPDGTTIINKVLIANRGEIACRVIATCRKLGVSTVSVYAAEDAFSKHVSEADEAIEIGSIERSNKNPFLDIDLLIKTTLEVGAQAIHPGYGYLSENPEFADRVREAGLIFIGPTGPAMSTLGDKRSSKEYLRKHASDVPLIPGFSGSSQKADDLRKAAEEIGLPVILKASSGGGGKGMRVVHEPSRLREELDRAQSEAQRSFGSSDCILEKFIVSSKHVEVQVIGDSYGTVVPLFERECSVQRRNQKIIEETPCRFLDDETRVKMNQTAVRIAQLIGYEGAGTVEFVLDVTTMNFYFLEVNTRLQVEHPITEEVTGLDLVSLQLFVAAGGRLNDLPIMSNLSQTGHAIECRLCAEDPTRNFFPDHGKIALWKPASEMRDHGSVIRHETAIRTGSTISIYFDSMISKIIVWAPTRALSISHMVQELANTACLGVKTNQLFLQSCLLHRAFRDPKYTTSFIPSYLNELLENPYSKDIPLHIPLIASIYLRELTSRTLIQPRRVAFQGIRTQFHNQHFDPFNIQSEVISLKTTQNNKQDKMPELSILLARKPTDASNTGGGIQEAYLHIIPDIIDRGVENDLSTAEFPLRKLTLQYKNISQELRNGQLWANSILYRVKVTDWDNLFAGEAISQGQESFPVGLETFINGQKITAYLAMKGGSPSEETSTVLCHLPTVGEWIEIHKHTLLSFFVSRREVIASQRGSAKRSVKAPMPCKVLSILKKSGDEVKVGESVMVIESMKMEIKILVEVSGKFQSRWKVGDAVNEGSVLCSVE